MFQGIVVGCFCTVHKRLKTNSLLLSSRFTDNLIAFVRKEDLWIDHAGLDFVLFCNNIMLYMLCIL